MGELQTTQIDFSQPPPAAIDFSLPPPAVEPLRLSDPRTVPNARIRNMTVDPTKNIHSTGQAFYEGAKMGALGASIPGVVYATVPGLIGAILGGTAGAAGGKKLAETVGAGDFGQEIGEDLGSLAGGAVGAGVTDAAVSAVRQSRLGNALQNVLGIASKDIVARVPVLGHLVRRPSFQDYLGAFQKGMKAPEPVYPGAPYPTATPEQLNPSLISESRTLPGMNSPEIIRPPAQPIPARSGLMLSGQVEAAPTPGAAGSMVESIAQPSPQVTPSGEGIPRTLSGESALTHVLGGRENSTLMKIAKARGLNVTQESQLKAGPANKLLIAKIVSSFSPEELEEVRAQYLENTRFRHVFPDIGEEAWDTMTLQTYFPDVKIPKTQLTRTSAALRSAGQAKPVVSPPSPLPSSPDLVDPLQTMLDAVKSGKKLADLH
jgi:hypothetical protein